MSEFLLVAWNQYIYPFLLSDWPIVIAILTLFGFAIRQAEDTSPYADLSNSLSQAALEALKDTFDQIGKSLRLDSPEKHAESISKHLSRVFKDFYEKADSLLKASIETVKVQAKETVMVFGNDNPTRAWRIAGAIITAILLGIFILADVIQAAYSLAEMTGFIAIARTFLVNLGRLGSLPFSIMISSVGTTATLAFILVDMWGITKFIPWELAPMRNGKSVLTRWVIFLLFITVLIAPLLALSRLRTQGLIFNSSLANELVRLLPMLAQVLLLFPMLATTVFLSYGAMIVYVVYLIGLGILQLLLLGIRGIFFLLTGLLSAIEPASTPAVGLFLVIFLGVIVILGMMAGVILTVSDSIFFLVGFVFLAIASVFRWIADLIKRLFRFRGNRAGATQH